MKNNDVSPILLIDDEPHTIDRLLALLRNDYTCHFALNGRAGLLLYQQHMNKDPLIICDINLPDSTGYEICRSIKAINRHSYVMLLTAYTDHQSKLTAYEAFADSFLDKAKDDYEIKLRIRNIYQTLYERRSTQQEHPITHKENQKHRTQTAQQIKPDIQSEIEAIILDYYQLTNATRKPDACTSYYIAAQLGLSQRSLQRKLKETTGLSFQIIYLNIRLKKAQQLLEQDFNVTQIAELLDFSSPAHLSRTFKEHFGMTPSKYKQHLLNSTRPP